MDADGSRRSNMLIFSRNPTDYQLVLPILSQAFIRVESHSVEGLVEVEIEEKTSIPTRYCSLLTTQMYYLLHYNIFADNGNRKTFGNYPLELKGLFDRLRGHSGQRKIQILRDFDGLIKSGEMVSHWAVFTMCSNSLTCLQLVVLGRPGSGCSTLLKTISGETDGFFVDSNSEINYQGS